MPKTAEAPRQSVVPLIRERLAAWGIVQNSRESLAETTARAMGIDMRTLRRELLCRAVVGA
jgi:hypothetical protein